MSWNYLVLSRKNTPKPSYFQQLGFGLVELMVSISIMAIIASVVLTRQDSFNGAILLRGQVYDIALHLRETQLSAVASIGDGTGFRSVQGLHFDTLQEGLYSSFIDAGGNMGYFDIGEEFGVQGKLDPRFEIRSIQTFVGATPTDRGDLSIVFARPNFDARFFNSSGEISNVSRIEVKIARRGVESSDPDYDAINVVRILEVTSTGQISVL